MLGGRRAALGPAAAALASGGLGLPGAFLRWGPAVQVLASLQRQQRLCSCRSSSSTREAVLERRKAPASGTLTPSQLTRTTRPQRSRDEQQHQDARHTCMSLASASMSGDDRDDDGAAYLAASSGAAAAAANGNGVPRPPSPASSMLQAAAAAAAAAASRGAAAVSRSAGGGGKKKEASRREAWVETYKLGKIALPLLLQYMISSSSHLINTSFVGHLSDPVLLSSMVLATSLSMATGYQIINGVASASETFCGQAFGANNYPALQATLQRALMIVALTCAPISLAWLNAEWILVHLGQPEAIAHGAAQYLQLTLPALYLYAVHECVDKYLLSQRVVKPSLLITAATTALTPLFAHHFVVQQDLGLAGAAYAYVAVQACTTALGLSYLGYRELVKLPRQPPAGWVPLRPSLSALSSWGPYVALAVPAVLSYCMEGWATEVLIFLSGMLDNADVAVGVTGLALQFSTLVWLAAASIGSATSTRVANKLGRGDAAGAKQTAQTAVLCVLGSQALIGSAAFTFREPLIGLMTNQPAVVQLALEVMPVLACCFVADGLNAVLGAVLRGAGRQWWTAGLNVAGWWGVGVPLAYYLAIVQGGNVPALWAGFATASALQSGLQWLAVNHGIDWEVEVQRAKALMAGHPPPATSSEEEEEGDGEGDGSLSAAPSSSASSFSWAAAGGNGSAAAQPPASGQRRPAAAVEGEGGAAAAAAGGGQCLPVPPPSAAS